MFAKKSGIDSKLLNSNEKAFLGLILIFWLIQLFGAFYQPTGYEYESIREKFKALDYPMRWLLLIPVFLLFRRYLLDWRSVAVGISLGAIIATGIAHYQVYFLGVSRAWGASSGQISFAEIMVTVDLLLWMFMIYAWDRGHKILSAYFLIASLVAFYGSLLSVTRGAWLAYVVMIVVWVVYTIGKSFKNIKYLFTTPVLLRLLFAGFVFWGVSQTDQYKHIEERTSSSINNFSKGGFESVDKTRASIVEDSIKIVKQYPIGIGTDNFDSIKVQSSLMTEKGYRFGHAHNELLTVAVENGIHGLVSLMAIILFAMNMFWKKLKSSNELARVYAASGLMLVISYMIFGQTNAVFSHHDTLIFFIFFLYFFLAQCEKSNA